MVGNSRKRTDDRGRAFAGSQLQIQIYVSRLQSELSAAVLAALAASGERFTEVTWVSPLARNLPERYDVELGLPRYEPVRQALFEGTSPPSAQNVVSCVEAVRNRISTRYGDRTVLSLSTKFLWLRFRAPVVIYDSQVRRALGTADGDIVQYYRRWHERFDAERADVDESCQALGNVRSYCVDPGIFDDPQVLDDIEQEWFKQRVFDVYLWHQGLDA